MVTRSSTYSAHIHKQHRRRLLDICMSTYLHACLDTCTHAHVSYSVGGLFQHACVLTPVYAFP